MQTRMILQQERTAKMVSRRAALRQIPVIMAAVSIGHMGSAQLAKASEGSISEHPSSNIVLAQALRTIGSPVCVALANRLEHDLGDRSTFDLHLRSANLGDKAAMLIAGAFQQITDRSLPELTSFSLSYNRDISSAGVIALAQSFPGSLKDLGLVGCGLGDASGAALAQWARQAPSLRTMCIEGNEFSDGTKTRLASLRQSHPHIQVYV